ncbi:Tryptophan synthase, alpha subunit [Nitrospina gracilis 3/211]|uniref:Tryptophan synthase alpha chain n=1 Tax=Nitrospina gracilis (strain 3/211) TaxID=1266370 RepID=M1YMN5_NITG3|nr:tryptophan synthase subunit alpha [Nitrospina gracilis]MCF8724536.1 tryptophan synthase alpha chain [Nitrospina sp. Nb-3]CCQ91705.1 Tryptophan synthase, alpha subunit [Nitrospina gracilis 3/211]
MNRIEQRIEDLRAKKQKTLVAFITAGDPSLDATKDIFQVIEENGADIVELGVPFSDPLADGPVIQAASQRSLKSGTTLKKILALVADLRKTSELPIVLMTSYNPVFVYGEEAFVNDAVAAGVDGVIVPDLPPEEAATFETFANGKGLRVIYLLAPTSTPDRVRMISEKSRGFIYYISLTGVTGMQSKFSDNLQSRIGEVKKITTHPVMIGFGISGPEEAKEASQMSDGVIVGSAIVKLVDQCSSPDERKEKIGKFIASIKSALNGA